MRKVHGVKRAKKIKTRLAELVAAEALSDFAPPKSGAARCHELEGDLKGFFTVDLDHPQRLRFQPIDDPPARKDDGGWDWSRIRSVEIIDIFDPHH